MSSRKRALLCSKVESLASQKIHQRTTSYFCPHCEADLLVLKLTKNIGTYTIRLMMMNGLKLKILLLKVETLVLLSMPL